MIRSPAPSSRRSPARENPQTVLGVFQQVFTPLDELKPRAAPAWVALEQVRDPGNLGTIIRTADAAGCGGVILIGDCCDPYSVEAVRATMGSVFAVSIARATTDAVPGMAREPGPAASSAPCWTRPTTTAPRPIERPALILMGNEQAGLTDRPGRRLRRQCEDPHARPRRQPEPGHRHGDHGLRRHRGNLMSSHTMTVLWENRNEPFTDNRYSRAHRWLFDGGVEVVASSSPSVVPVPMSLEAAVDPEEAFIASISSCHMLWFLAVTAKAGFKVTRYEDQPEGHVGKNDQGKLSVTVVTLRPAVTFEGDAPTTEQLDALHHDAHEHCFIAHSVKTDVRCEPRQEAA